MLKIRLQRVGRRNISIFRIVVTDARTGPKSGRYLEAIGSYDPVHHEKTVNAERARHWLSVGAQPSHTIHNFFVDQKIIAGKKIPVRPRARPVAKEKKEGDLIAAAGEEGGKEGEENRGRPEEPTEKKTA